MEKKIKICDFCDNEIKDDIMYKVIKLEKGKEQATKDMCYECMEYKL